MTDTRTRTPKVLGTKTAERGVYRISTGVFRIRRSYTDPRTGKQREIDRVVKAKDTRAAAAMLTALCEETRAGTQAPDRVTLRDFATSFLDGRRRAGRKRSTLERYATTIDLHITPVLGDYFVDAIRPVDAERWWSMQKGEPSTCNGRLRVLRSVLEAAKESLELPRNAASNIEPMPEGRDEDDHRVIDAEGLAMFLESMKEEVPQWYPMTLALALTGARFGEISSLKWSDISEEEGVIHIRRAHYRGTVGTPKTGKSRKVPLRPELLDVLRSHRVRTLKEQRVGIHEGWVFPTLTGTLSTPGALTKPFSKALAAVAKRCKHEGRPNPLEGRRPSPHWLRYSLNSLLRKAAAGEVQRAITGHASRRMSEHYDFVTMDERKAGLDRALALTRIGVGQRVGVSETKKEESR